MCNKTSGWGVCPRILLALLNFIFFLLGLAVFVAAAILKFQVLNDVKWLKYVYEFKELNLSEIVDTSLIVIMCVSGFITFVSLIGLFGAMCANKCLLVFYIIIVSILFLAHLAGFIYFLVEKPKILEKLGDGIKEGAKKIVANTTENVDKTFLCAAFLGFSEVLDCCGANGAKDFVGVTFNDTINNVVVDASKFCCKNITNIADLPGCAPKLTSLLNDYNTPVVIAPNAVALSFEFIFVILIAVLLHSIKKEERRPNNVNRNNFNYYDRSNESYEIGDINRNSKRYY